MGAKRKHTTKKSLETPNIKALEKIFDGDLDLVLFFLTWVKNGQNATKAYQELNPKIDYGSAAVLGSRMLKKVKIENILDTYGLGLEKYIKQLRSGLEANKWNDFTGDREPDHRTRKPYHDKLGKLLGVETSNETMGMEFKKGDQSFKIVVSRGE